jgi:FKBP-type peptidyl-prolyl cis-trans isomerase FkpA
MKTNLYYNKQLNMQIGKILYAVAFLFTAVACNNVDFKKTKGGMPYKLFSNGKGEKLQPGNFMKVQFAQKLNDSILVSTYPTGPRILPVPPQSYPYDISEVIPQMRKGDSVYAVQLVDTFIKQNPDKIPPAFKKGMKIITTIKVIDVYKTQEEAQAAEAADRETAFRNDKKVQAQLAKDIQVVKDYLSKNNIQAQSTPGGVYVQVVTQGAGPHVEKGKYVTLKYKGTTFAGKVFDSNMDTTFKHMEPLGFLAGKGQMMKGFDEAVLLLKQGDKARIFIPSALAYGEHPPSPAIGPNENLIFEVEVLDVVDKAPQPQFQMPGGESPHQ